MATKTASIDKLVEELSNARSAKRRAAAKSLRKLGDPIAGAAIEEALRREVQDPRTWETQYQMIMALGECRYEPSVPLLLDLSTRKLEHMVYVAIGDALVRLSADPEKELLRVLSTGKPALAEGALRAVAMLRLDLSTEAIESVIAHVAKPENEQLRFWVAAAAPGWDGPTVQAFLHDCSRLDRKETREAAQAALKKKYLRWNPL
jgi:HEAT repeat protein